MKKLNVLRALAIAGLLMVPLAAGAAPPGDGTDGDTSTIPTEVVTDVKGLIAIIDKIVNIFFTILLILAVIFILVAAYKYLTAGGDPEKVKSAHHVLIYALVAVAVAVLAKSLIAVIRNFVGAS